MDNVLHRELQVLVAEDDSISSYLIEKILKQFNCSITHAKNGSEVVELCKQNPEIDLILMDVKMPYIDGLEATKQIREFNKDIIIVAQTAFSLIGDKEKALEAGCNEHISKPIEQEKLMTIINKYFK